MRNVASDLPAGAGAYILTIRLDVPLRPDIRAFRGTGLTPGLYAYCGSARGPGGIRARVARHLRKSKPFRWHVDRLTAVGSVERIWVAVGGNECDLADEILSRGGTMPLPGFGSSDCNRCRAHLIALPDFPTLNFPGLTVIRAS
jgi:Uri superfamily endonuclease